MPYKSTKIKLSREQDRRVKLTEEQRDEIRHKYETGLYSQRQLADEYKVSRRLITFVLNPEKERHNVELFKERRKDGRYKPSKSEWAETMREHRQYKEELYKQGKLKEDK